MIEPHGLPSSSERLQAAEPGQQWRRLGKEAIWWTKTIVAVLAAMQLGVKVLGLGFVPQSTFTEFREKNAVQLSAFELRLVTQETRLSDHLAYSKVPNDTPSRTASMYPTGAHR